MDVAHTMVEEFSWFGAIAALAVHEGWGLLEMGGGAASLEQVFVDAISRTGAGPAA